jgi:hypothetical protein
MKFYALSNPTYQFLIWKVQPKDLKAYSAEVQELVEKNGYQLIPGVCDVSTYNPNQKMGYKVSAVLCKFLPQR